MDSIQASNVWLDCDPGHDDAFAILLCAFTKQINLIGISTVSGNQLINNMTSNCLKILNTIGYVSDSVNDSDLEKNVNSDLKFSDCLEKGGLKCPVIEGCGIPFLGKPVTASYIHGETGLEGDWPITPSHAVEYVQKLSSQNHFTTEIYRHFKSLGKPITILATGPLTNIALLLFNYPDIRKYIEKIVFMGGAMCLGNTGPLSEFNIHADPLAASMVCESGLPVYMVSLDCTNEALFDYDIIAEIKRLSSRCSDLFAHLLDHLMITCYSCTALHDPVAAFYLIDPSCFETKLIRVDVECNKNALNFAQTICDFKNKTDRPKNVHICYKTNVDKFWEKMIEVIKLAKENSPLKN